MVPDRLARRRDSKLSGWETDLHFRFIAGDVSSKSLDSSGDQEGAQGTQKEFKYERLREAQN